MTQTKPKAGEGIAANFQQALVEKQPTQEEEEERRIEQGPSTKDTILMYLQSRISYAIYAGVCCLLITILVGFLWRYALNVDWSEKTSPRSGFPPNFELP